MAEFPSPQNRTSPGADPDHPAPLFRPIARLEDRSHRRRSIGFRRLEGVIPKREIFTWCGCLLMFQLLGAASASGYIITALFLFVAIGRLARSALHELTARLPKRSPLKHYATASLSLLFFCLLVIRVCFVATVIIDSAIRDDHVEVSGEPERQF